MKIILSKFLPILILFTISPKLHADVYYSELALKDLSDFLVFSQIPVGEKTLSDKINKAAEKCFAKMGKVSNIKLLVQTPEGEAVDFSHFRGDGHLCYSITSVKGSDGLDSGFFQASLSITAPVTIEKNKIRENVIIWSKEYFLKGDLQINGEGLVVESLEVLLKKFTEQYKKANSSQPTFKFCTMD